MTEVSPGEDHHTVCGRLMHSSRVLTTKEEIKRRGMADLRQVAIEPRGFDGLIKVLWVPEMHEDDLHRQEPRQQGTSEGYRASVVPGGGRCCIVLFVLCHDSRKCHKRGNELR